MGQSTITRRRFAQVAAMVVLGTAAAAARGEEAWRTFYVAPNGRDAVCTREAPGSLTNGRDKVRSVRAEMAGDIHVVLADGTYTLSETLQLTEADSGTNGHTIVWRAAHPGEAILSGGRDVSGGWVLHDKEKNIWRKTGIEGEFRQLYVNERRAIRARIPNLDPEDAANGACYSMDDTTYPFTIPTGTIGEWANAGYVEFIWKGAWRQLRARVKSYEDGSKGATLTFQDPEGKCRRLNHANYKPMFYYFENHYDLLDGPGEWFFDVGERTLFYKPREGETMSEATVIAPRVDVLLSVEGRSQSERAGRLRFSGLVFRFSNWTAPSREGYMTQQAARSNDASGDPQKIGDGESPSAMVEFKNADHLVFERNCFEFSGAHGLSGLVYTDDVVIRGNVFRDMSAGGIWIHQAYKHVVGARRVSIDNNLITDYGRHYRDAVGIGVGLASHTSITHNEVRRGVYSGISLGWEWEERDNGLRQNEVAYNRVHEICRLTDDGGGLYTLGRMDNTRIHHNYFYDIGAGPFSHGWHGNRGIYLDSGSQGMLVERNVVETYNGSAQKCQHLWARKHPKIHSNAFHDNYVNGPSSEIDTKNGRNSEAGTQVLQGRPWPPEALAVMDAAGITSAYADIAVDLTHGRNAAVGAAASASSIMDDGSPAAAGNDNDLLKGLWASKGVKDDPSPWWQVDLGRPHRIYQVDVLPRVDGADQASTRASFVVWGANSPDFGERTELARQGARPFPHRQMKSFMVADNGSYRYVRVGRPGKQGHFNLAEVRVMGVPMPEGHVQGDL